MPTLITATVPGGLFDAKIDLAIRTGVKIANNRLAQLEQQDRPGVESPLSAVDLVKTDNLQDETATMPKRSLNLGIDRGQLDDDPPPLG